MSDLTLENYKQAIGKSEEGVEQAKNLAQEEQKSCDIQNKNRLEVSTAYESWLHLEGAQAGDEIKDCSVNEKLINFMK